MHELVRALGALTAGAAVVAAVILVLPLVSRPVVLGEPTGVETPFGVADGQGHFPHVSAEIGARRGAWDGVPNGITVQVEHVAGGIAARRTAERRMAAGLPERRQDPIPRVRDEGAACDTDADCVTRSMGRCGEDPIAMNRAFAARVDEVVLRRSDTDICPHEPATWEVTCTQGYCVLPGAPDLDNRRPRLPQPDGKGFWFKTPTHRNGLRAWGGEKTEADFPPQPVSAGSNP